MRRPAPDTPPSREPKPLWRFGPAGWCALAAGIPLLVVAAAGFNPVFWAQSAVIDRWQWNGLAEFTAWGLVYPWMHLRGIAPGPFALMWVLLAFGLSPRPVPPHWAALLTLLCLLTPFLHYLIAVRNLLGINAILQTVHLGGPTSLNAIELLALAAALWRFTGSRRVGIAIALLSALCLVPWEIAWTRNLGAWDWTPLWDATVALWHTGCAATVTAWGLAERRRFRRPSICRTCGYDLTGCNDGPCPECGTPRPDAATASPPVNSPA